MPVIKSFPDDIILAQCDMLHPSDMHKAIVLFKTNSGVCGTFCLWNVDKRDGWKSEGSAFPIAQYANEHLAKVDAYEGFSNRVRSMINRST